MLCYVKQTNRDAVTVLLLIKMGKKNSASFGDSSKLLKIILYLSKI